MSKLALKTKNGELVMPLSKALWVFYGLPGAIGLLGYFYGIEGLALAAGLILITLKK